MRTAKLPRPRSAGPASYECTMPRFGNRGIRTVLVSGSKFLINGEPFYFKGFGKHEDCEYRGRGYDPVVMLRDFELLDWIGANSVRTSHYPYSEEFMQMADRKGLVVIDETPAVGMFDLMMNFIMAGMGAGHTEFFDREDVKTETLANHKRAIEELVQRDKNHPCVVMWCLANEPDTAQEASRPYFEQVFTHARGLDTQHRPLTFTNFMRAPFGKCKVHDFADVILLNRYYGRYPGFRLQEIGDRRDYPKGISKNCNLASCTYEIPLWCTDLRSIVSINRVVFRCAPNRTSRHHRARHLPRLEFDRRSRHRY